MQTRQGRTTNEEQDKRNCRRKKEGTLTALEKTICRLLSIQFVAIKSFWL